MIRTEDLIYRPPAGFRDDFFLYVLNGDNLTAGATYHDLPTPIDMDADFVLRRVDGLGSLLGTTTGSWNIRYPDGRYLFAGPVFVDNGVVNINTLRNGSSSPGVIPEIVYGKGTSIRTDLYVVSPETFDPGIEVLPWGSGGQIVYWGVKRKELPSTTQPQLPPGKWLPFTYETSILIDWAAIDGTGARTAARQYYLPINNHDFILWGINQTAGGPWVRVVLYDSTGEARMSGPVDLQLIDSMPVGNTRLVLRGAAITPGILYPNGSQIRLDINSMFGAIHIPVTIRLSFFGVQRMG